MTDDRNHSSCAAFQAQLAELIGTGEDISAHPHIQTCAQCRALLADLYVSLICPHTLTPPTSLRKAWFGNA